MPSAPSDDMIVLAALLRAGTDWACADDIASVLRQFGFEITSQKMTGALQRLLREDMPMFEQRKRAWADVHEYRVTKWGLCQLGNRFPRLRPTIRMVEGTHA